MSEVDNKSGIDWKAGLYWEATTFVAVEMVVLIFYVAFKTNLFDKALTSVMVVGVASVLFGCTQWLWWRKRVRNAHCWIAATVFGWCLGTALFATYGALYSLPKVEQFVDKLGWPGAAFCLCLVPIGFVAPQWFLLRKNFRKAGYWITVRPLAWLAGFGLVVLGENLNVVGSGFLWEPDRVFGRVVPEVIAWGGYGALFGIGFGTVTGVTIVWIFRHPRGSSYNGLEGGPSVAVGSR